MYQLRTRSRTALLLGFIIATGFSPVAQTEGRITEPTLPEITLNVDSAASTIHWTLDSTLHTVHGTFTVTKGTLHFDPKTGLTSGEFVVSATSGQSGNSSRDGRMHKEILETAKYPDAVFHPKQIEGNAGTSGTFDVKLKGTLSIHGSDHDITADVHVEMARDHWTGTSKFEIPYVKWAIKDPSNFLLKVKPVVDVEVEMTGTIGTPK